MWTYRCPPSALSSAPSDSTKKATVKDIPNRTQALSHTPISFAAAPEPAAASAVQTQPSPKASVCQAIRGKERAKPRKGYTLVSALYLIGLCCGVAAVRSLPQLTSFLSLYGQNLMQSNSHIGADMIFSIGFLGYIGVLTALLLAGLCAFGGPLVLTLFFLRGLWESAYITSLYAQSGWQGILLYTIAFWFPGLLCIGFQICFASEALRMSRLLRQDCLTGSSAGLRPGVKQFFLRFLTLGSLGVVAAVLQAAFFLMFGHLFV